MDFLMILVMQSQLQLVMKKVNRIIMKYLIIKTYIYCQGHGSRNHYAEINNLDAIGITEKLSGFNKPKSASSKRPPSTLRKPV